MVYNIVTLIVHTIAGIFATILLLRFWTQAVRVRPPSSIGSFMYQLSDWLVKPLRRLLPGFGGYDWACLIGAFLVALLAVAADLWLAGFFSVEFLLLQAIFRLAEWILYGFMGLIIIEVIFSWVNPNAPLAPFVRALTDPLMRPLRRIIPLVGNIDLSPLVAFLILRIALYLVGALAVSVM
ncbi:MAG: YggT family protein [Burkholderiaceae bacterium]